MWFEVITCFCLIEKISGRWITNGMMKSPSRAKRFMVISVVTGEIVISIIMIGAVVINSITIGGTVISSMDDREMIVFNQEGADSGVTETPLITTSNNAVMVRSRRLKYPQDLLDELLVIKKNQSRGCVIYCCAVGRGGSKINDLQFESGCRINVTKEQDGDETLVVLTGDEAARQKAEGLINELTVDRGERPTLRVVDPSAEGATDGGSFGGEAEVIDWQKLSEECVSMIFLSVLNLL